MRTNHIMKLALWLLALGSACSMAASFEVNPVRMDLSQTARTSSLTIRNTSADPVVIQASVVTWTQAEGKDVYAATKEILVTPPIITIPPGKEQILRAGLRRNPDPRTELAYRIYLQEAPPPPQPGFQGLQVALRIGLPLFVQPTQGPAQAALVWNLTRGSDGALRLELRNDGNAHIQVSEVQLMPKGTDEVIGTQSSLTYLLPKQSHAWDFKIASDNAQKVRDRLRIKVATDAGSIDTEVPLSAP
jgi:fimbrial chaperone protein